MTSEDKTWDTKVNEITQHLKGKELKDDFDESDLFYTQIHEYLTVDREITLTDGQETEIKIACQNMWVNTAHATESAAFRKM